MFQSLKGIRVNFGFQKVPGKIAEGFVSIPERDSGKFRGGLSGRVSSAFLVVSIPERDSGKFRVPLWVSAPRLKFSSFNP